MATRKKQEVATVLLEADDKILINLKELMQRTGLGRPLALKLADEAGANVYIGRKHLFDANKIRLYTFRQAI